MSDLLAPFVASVLRDESLWAVQNQNRRLREMLSVRITGPEGTPVYAHASLAQDGQKVRRDAPEDDGWLVSFQEKTLVPCLAEDLVAIEIRVGGVVVLTGADLMDHEYGRVFEECRFDEDTGYCEFDMYNLFDKGMGLCTELQIQIGPYESINEYEEQVKGIIPHPYTDLHACRDLERVCAEITFHEIELDYEKAKFQVKACQRQLE